MIKFLISVCIVVFVGINGFAKPQSKRSMVQTSKILLREGWSIQSSAKVTEEGDVLSKNHYQPRGWYTARVPSTVLATLVEDKVYPDPLVGENLRLIPGCSYPIGANFSNLPMPEDSPFRVSWW